MALGDIETVKVIGADGQEVTVKLKTIGIVTTTPPEPTQEPVPTPEAQG